MMHEIFDAVIERAGTDSMKWDVKEGVISMGIADMDFKAAPCIQEALRRKVEFGVFGYADIPQTYYESYQHWWGRAARVEAGYLLDDLQHRHCPGHLLDGASS